MAKFTKQARQISNALTLLYHHKIKPKVETAPDGSTQISFNAPASMAAAYVENHLDEQLGPRFPFEVEAGGQRVYITIPAPGNGTKKAGNPHPARPKRNGGPSPKRWSVRCKTTDGNWRSVASELTKGEAAREAKIYERKGYESCVFEGRRKVK